MERKSSKDSKGTAATPARPRRKKRTNSSAATAYGAAKVPVVRPKLWYVAQFGNNSPLIRQLMRNRPGWAAGPGDPGNQSGKTDYEEKRVKVQVQDDSPEIQFLWTQNRETKFIDAIAEQQPGMCITLNEEYKLQLKQKILTPETPPCTIPRVHNHFEGNDSLCTKCGLRESMKQFYFSHGRDPFGAIPITFVIRKGSQDEEFTQFSKTWSSIDASDSQRLWLVKPGEWANRGCGIKIFDTLEEVADRVDSKEKVWVVQKYIEHPFLIHRRKFDIRSYLLVTQDAGAGAFHAYHHRDSYLRTVSAEFTMESLDRMIHLSNDAVQDKGEDYGKYETANKMSLDEFQRYLNNHHAENRISVEEHIVPQMHALMADTMRAVAHRLNPRGVDHCFEILGFDFMIDANFRVWLIEVNTNPCLEGPCNLLSRIIPKMVDEALRLTLDRIFPWAAAPPPPPAPERSRTRLSRSSATSCKPPDPDTGTGFKEIWNSSFPDEISCDWVGSLPTGTEVDFTTLGHEILKAPAPSKKGRK